MPLLQHLTSLAHKRQAGVLKEGLRRRWWDRKSVATTRLHRHDDGSSFSRILTVRNDISFVEGIYYFIDDNISRRDATRRPNNAQSRRMDRRWLFRTPPIHQGGGATVTAHDFKREPICQLQWGLSTSNEFLSSSFWCTLFKSWWLFWRPSWSDIDIFSTVLRSKLNCFFGCSRSLVHISLCTKVFFIFS
jgi:hypothetical protein